MNHDLIAAGHPRLTFEYAAYHDLLPRHWRDKASEAEPWEVQSKKFGNDFEARAWLLGQAVTAQATVKLTEARCEAGRAADAPVAGVHRGRAASPATTTCRRTARGGRKAAATPTRRPGRRRGARGCGRCRRRWHASRRPRPGRQAVRRSRGLRVGSPARRRKGSRDARQRLARWRGRCEKASLDEAAVRKLLAALAADGVSNPPRDWDDAAQHYLALAALYQSLANFDPAPRHRPAASCSSGFGSRWHSPPSLATRSGGTTARSGSRPKTT